MMTTMMTTTTMTAMIQVKKLYKPNQSHNNQIFSTYLAVPNLLPPLNLKPLPLQTTSSIYLAPPQVNPPKQTSTLPLSIFSALHRRLCSRNPKPTKRPSLAKMGSLLSSNLNPINHRTEWSSFVKLEIQMHLTLQIIPWL